MKSDDLIDRYMGSNKWENPYYEVDDPLDYKPEPPIPIDPADPVEPSQYELDKNVWLGLKSQILKDPIGLSYFRRWSYDDIQDGGSQYGYDVKGQDAYRFIRKIMEKATNPYGGYLYRRYHYLGYTSTLGILIPQGFKVAEEETFSASVGGSPTLEALSDRFIKLCQNMGLMTKPKGKWYTDPFGRRSWHGPTPTYIKSEWLERYVIIYTDYFDYPQYWLDEIVNALISDLYFAKIRTLVEGTFKTFTNQKVSDPILDIFNVGGKNTFSPYFTGDAYTIYKDQSVFITNKPYYKTLLRVGFFISEMLLLLKYFKRLGSMIPFPVFPNFGFKGTMPSAIIDKNIGQVVDLLDNFFGIDTAAMDQLPSKVKDLEASIVTTFIDGDPPEPPSPPPSSPPSGGYPPKIDELE